jgi:hypothetical protein
MNYYRFLLRLSFICLVVIISIPTAHAQPSWQLEINTTPLWDDNPLMQIDNAIAIKGFETGLKASVHNPDNSPFAALLEVNHNRFDRSDFNSTDLSGAVDYRKEFKRSIVSVSGAYQYDTTRSIQNPVLGLVTQTDRWQSFQLKPDIQYQLNKRLSFNLMTLWKKTRYDNASLTDYRIITAEPSLFYKLSQNKRLGFNLQTRLYQSLQSEREALSFGPS